jgi:4-amino-4-deoxy-L-arabinose transferase-like glycosyltransferase
MLVFALATAWLCASVPVFAQESYYWCYAQKPDLSYFDHPPMVAWLIWLGTACFGDGAWGIRAGTWLCGLGATAVGAIEIVEGLREGERVVIAGTDLFENAERVQVNE